MWAQLSCADCCDSQLINRQEPRPTPEEVLIDQLDQYLDPENNACMSGGPLCGALTTNSLDPVLRYRRPTIFYIFK